MEFTGPLPGPKAFGRSQGFVIRDEMHLKPRRPISPDDPCSRVSRPRLRQVRERGVALKPLTPCSADSSCGASPESHIRGAPGSSASPTTLA